MSLKSVKRCAIPCGTRRKKTAQRLQRNIFPRSEELKNLKKAIYEVKKAKIILFWKKLLETVFSSLLRTQYHRVVTFIRGLLTDMSV